MCWSLYEMFGSLSQVLVSQCWCLLHQLKINVSEPHLMVSVAHRFLRKPAAPLSQSYQYSSTVKTTFQKFAAEAGMQHPLFPLNASRKWKRGWKMKNLLSFFSDIVVACPLHSAALTRPVCQPFLPIKEAQCLQTIDRKNRKTDTALSGYCFLAKETWRSF